MRHAVLAAGVFTRAATIVLGVAAAGEGGTGSASAARLLLGVSGNAPRFKSQTGQESQVVQAFVGWGQGDTYGSKFAALFATLGPIPMIHLGTRGRNGREAVTPAGIAAGQGDAYLMALNAAIAAWGKGIYIGRWPR
jgi:hypothetical protein